MAKNQCVICLQEERLRKLEQSEAIMGTKLDNLIKELDELTATLKNLIWLSFPVIVALFGFLIAYWIKK